MLDMFDKSKSGWFIKFINIVAGAVEDETVALEATFEELILVQIVGFDTMIKKQGLCENKSTREREREFDQKGNNSFASRRSKSWSFNNFACNN